jgi:hypothetical protein
VFCDYLCYVFMFLSVATSNMVATSVAKKVHPTLTTYGCYAVVYYRLCVKFQSPHHSYYMQDKELTQHQVSMLLFVGLVCGIGMFLFTKFFGTQVLTGKNLFLYVRKKRIFFYIYIKALLTYNFTSCGAFRFLLFLI